MVQGRQYPGLDHEASLDLGVADQPTWKLLDGDRSVEAQVPSGIDNPEATTTKFSVDLIVREGGGNRVDVGAHGSGCFAGPGDGASQKPRRDPVWQTGSVPPPSEEPAYGPRAPPSGIRRRARRLRRPGEGATVFGAPVDGPAGSGPPAFGDGVAGAGVAVDPGRVAGVEPTDAAAPASAKGTSSSSSQCPGRASGSQPRTG